MEIKIKTGDELKRLLDELAMEIVDANIFYQLFTDIVDSIKDYTKEFQQSNTFWTFTLAALQDAALVHLCRVFDQETASLNLFNLLETIKANLHFFEDGQFRERLKDNAFVELLARENRMPDKAQLDGDVLFVSNSNPHVKKLMVWRNNIIAHRGAKISLGKNQILRDNPLSKDELLTLLDESLKNLNRYSSLFRASTYSKQVSEHDDFKALLKFIRLGIQKMHEDNRKQIEEIKKSQAEQSNQGDGE